MVYDYVVTLRNRTSRLVDAVSILVSLITVAFLISDMLKAGRVVLVQAVICGLILLILAWNQIPRLRGRNPAQYSKALLVAGLGWFTMPLLPWLAIPIFVLAFLEKPAKSNLEIGFLPDRIVMNSLIKQHFEWSEFTNIMLKDDLLTMDFKNNKLFQRMTIDDEPDATEDEFNEYCSKQLSLHV